MQTSTNITAMQLRKDHKIQNLFQLTNHAKYHDDGKCKKFGNIEISDHTLQFFK